MMKNVCALSMMLVFVSVAALAQTESAPAQPSVFSNYLNPQSGASFLRVPGLSFSSSAGFSYSSGGGGESFGMGYYMGHFGLKLSSSISLNWDVGIGSVMHGASDYNQPQFFIPNMDLTYRPSDNFLLRIEYHQSPYAGSRRPFGR